MPATYVIELLRMVLMVGAAAFAVLTDMRERRIPNRLTAPLAVAGLVIGAVGGGLGGLALAVAGGLAGGLFFLIPVAKLGWGMGDLKIAAALGALGGPLFALWMGLYALAAGGLFALIWLRQQGQLAPVAAGIGGDLRAGKAPTARSGLSIPFAVPIAAGMLVALFVSPGLPSQGAVAASWNRIDIHRSPSPQPSPIAMGEGVLTSILVANGNAVTGDIPLSHRSGRGVGVRVYAGLPG